MTRRGFALPSASCASLAGGLGAILLPKCPLCLAALGSALGALGLPTTHRWLVEPLIAGAVLASFGVVLAGAVRRRDTATPLVSAMGAGLVLGGRLALETPAITVVGAVLLVAAALASAELTPCGSPTRSPSRSPSRDHVPDAPKADRGCHEIGASLTRYEARRFD